MIRNETVIRSAYILALRRFDPRPSGDLSVSFTSVMARSFVSSRGSLSKSKLTRLVMGSRAKPLPFARNSCRLILADCLVIRSIF